MNGWDKEKKDLSKKMKGEVLFQEGREGRSGFNVIFL